MNKYKIIADPELKSLSLSEYIRYKRPERWYILYYPRNIKYTPDEYMKFMIYIHKSQSLERSWNKYNKLSIEIFKSNNNIKEIIYLIPSVSVFYDDYFQYQNGDYYEFIIYSSMNNKSNLDERSIHVNINYTQQHILKQYYSEFTYKINTYIIDTKKYILCTVEFNIIQSNELHRLFINLKNIYRSHFNINILRKLMDMLPKLDDKLIIEHYEKLLSEDPQNAISYLDKNKININIFIDILFDNIKYHPLLHSVLNEYLLNDYVENTDKIYYTLAHLILGRKDDLIEDEKICILTYLREAKKYKQADILYINLFKEFIGFSYTDDLPFSLLYRELKIEEFKGNIHDKLLNNIISDANMNFDEKLYRLGILFKS